MRLKIDPFCVILFLCWVAATVLWLYTRQGTGTWLEITIMVAGFLGVITTLRKTR